MNEPTRPIELPAAAGASPELIERLRHDPQRPRYHFQPPAFWMNDPNGLIQWQGRYHLFYQHHPYGPLHANMHWGHAVSDDLVHWQHQPIALAPTPDSPDQDGVYSGCAVNHNGVPTIIYTGVRGPDQRVCLATAEDDQLRRWRKHPANPVIAEPPEGLDLVAYRDPAVWRAGQDWYMVHGAGIVDVGGAALLYRSSNLVDWDYLGPLLVGAVHRQTPFWTGTMWECPQLFALGDRHLLLIAVWSERVTRYAMVFVGHFDGRHFTPERELLLDGGTLYAPQAMEDERGRRLLWGWLRESRSREAQAAASWSGVMSLPRQVTLGDDGLPRYTPVVEIDQLRGPLRLFAAQPIPADSEPILTDAGGAQLEIAARIEPGTATAVGLIVRRAPDGQEQTTIVYEPASGQLVVEREHSSLDPATSRERQTVPLTLAEGEPLRLRLYLDASVIEVFANERACLSTRIYPTRADSLGLALVARGGPARLAELHLWPMAAS